MTNIELQEQLLKVYTDFIELLNKQTQREFTNKLTPGKWSNGQTLDHIVRGTEPISRALGLPKEQLIQMFGESDHASATYNGLVSNYHTMLSEGGKASGKYLPEEITFEDRSGLVERLFSSIEKMVLHLSKFSEDGLEKFVIPHPLLGKLTVREMMYFTIYHVQHHQKIVENNLAVEDPI